LECEHVYELIQDNQWVPSRRRHLTSRTNRPLSTPDTEVNVARIASVMHFLVYTCLLSLVSSAVQSAGSDSFDAFDAVPIDTNKRIVNLFFMRHVESQWNCYKNINIKNDETITDKTKSWTDEECTSRQISGLRGYGVRHRDASISKKGSEQLQTIYDTAGKELVDKALADDANNLKKSLARLTRSKKEPKKAVFLTSNLRRAQITTLALRKSLLNAAEPGSVISTQLDAAKFQIDATLQEHGGPDAFTMFGGGLLTPTEPLTPEERAEWKKYLKDKEVSEGQWRYPTAGLDLFSTLTESLPNYTYDAEKRFRFLISKMAKDHHEVFIMGGHSSWFRDILLIKRSSAAVKQEFPEYFKRKLHNGEMARVNLIIKYDPNNPENYGRDWPKIEIQRIDTVWPPKPVLVPALAMSEYANMLSEEHDALDEFSAKQERLIEQLRNAEWREWEN